MHPEAGQQLQGEPLRQEVLYEADSQAGRSDSRGRTAETFCLGAYQTTKACSNVNVVGIDNYCMKNDVVSTPGGVAVKNSYTQCYCKSKQFCNGAGPVPLLVPLVLGIFILF